MDDASKKPILMAGLLIGLLTGITSIVPFCGCFCCLLIPLAGGVAAVKLYMNETGGRLPDMAGAAKLGVLAGAVGAVLYLVLAFALDLLISAAFFAMAPDVDNALAGRAMAFFAGVVGKFVSAVILIGLSTVGAILGVQIFGGGSKPAAPPQYPGQPGAYPGGPQYPGGPTY